MTTKADERRSDQRLRYRWFMEYSRSVKEPLSQGRMVDISSTGAAFICPSREDGLCFGKLVTTRFSVPRFDSDISFDIQSFDRIGRICRVDSIGDLRRIAIQFARSLPLKPGEQPISEYDRTYRLSTGSSGLAASASPSVNRERGRKSERRLDDTDSVF
ncbi:MAG: PilZ domain-containing protein [Sedimentisphaerales bacterium]|nr:PilZ domain-containing protein [Sedimentisphaerales bacterium]